MFNFCYGRIHNRIESRPFFNLAGPHLSAIAAGIEGLGHVSSNAIRFTVIAKLLVIHLQSKNVSKQGVNVLS